MTEFTSTPRKATKFEVGREALDLADRGLNVFPVDAVVLNNGVWESSKDAWRRKYARRDGEEFQPKEKPGKKPLVPWKTKCTKDPDQVDRWFSDPSFRNANLGVATGEISGIWALDVDGAAGEASLADLERTYGELPVTVTAVTHSGGRHFWFRLQTGTDLRNTAGALAPGLDVRGNGGFIVVPPSRGYSGNKYRYADGRSPRQVEFAEAPEWLLAGALAAMKKNRSAPTTTKANSAVLRGSEPMTGAAPSAGNVVSIPELRKQLARIGDGDGRGGFDTPINQAACAYFALHGAEADAEPLKQALRIAISLAPTKPERGHPHRYLADDYLDGRIENARDYIASSADAKARERETSFDDEEELVAVLNAFVGTIWIGNKLQFLIESESGHKIVQAQEARNALAPYRLFVRVKGGMIEKAGFDTWLKSARRRICRQDFRSGWQSQH